MSTAPTSNAPGSIGLRRALSLWDLILYGMIVIQPTAPMPVYGVMSQRAHGHAVTTVLIAMVAMLFTAIAYGRMARAYPSAGSAFTYVGQEINPALGYVTGWSMVMDYMLNPMICIVWCSQQANVFAPGIPYWGWALFFGAVFTFLNIQGIKTSARVNAGMAAVMSAVRIRPSRYASTTAGWTYAERATAAAYRAELLLRLGRHEQPDEWLYEVAAAIHDEKAPGSLIPSCSTWPALSSR